MEIHGYQWISMEIHGFQGYPWKSMDIHGYLWISMDIPPPTPKNENIEIEEPKKVLLEEENYITLRKLLPFDSRVFAVFKKYISKSFVDE